jgi:hypothetical protein
MEKLSKIGVMEYYDLEEEEFKELEESGLVPDKSEKCMEKFAALLKKSSPFSEEEILFLGRVDLKTFQNLFPAEAEEYMDM